MAVFLSGGLPPAKTLDIILPQLLYFGQILQHHLTSLLIPASRLSTLFPYFYFHFSPILPFFPLSLSRLAGTNFLERKKLSDFFPPLHQSSFWHIILPFQLERREKNAAKFALFLQYWIFPCIFPFHLFVIITNRFPFFHPLLCIICGEIALFSA